VSEPRAKHNHREDWVERRIAVWCDAPSHDPIELCALVSRYFAAGGEKWAPDSEAVRQSLIHPDDLPIAEDSPEAVHLLGWVSHRYKIQCGACGDDLTYGDLLDKGYKTLEAERSRRLVREGVERSDSSVTVEPKRIPPAWETFYRLSVLADSGVARLSLSSLRRIVEM
jgi:hypothetical protein